MWGCIPRIHQCLTKYGQNGDGNEQGEQNTHFESKILLMLFHRLFEWLTILKYKDDRMTVKLSFAIQIGI